MHVCKQPNHLPTRPYEIPTHTQARTQPRTPSFVDWSLGDGALGSDAGDDAIHAGLDDDAADDHLAQGGVQGLEVEDEVQLADVLEQLVQRLDVHLDQVQQGQGRLGGRRYDDEVQRRVVAVRHEGRHVVVRLRRRLRRPGCGEQRRQREEVACARRPVRDEREYLRDKTLLDAGFLF